MDNFRFVIMCQVFFFVFGCSTKKNKETLFLAASVGENIITIDDLNSRLGIKTKDSLSVYRFLSGWVEKELLYQAGVSQGIGLDNSVVQKIANYKKDVVGNAFLNLNVGASSIVEDDVIKYYKDNKEGYKRKAKEVLVYYFSSQVRSDALKIKKELKKGKKKLSKALSKYGGTRETVSFGGFPSKINNSVFNKKNFKNENTLGPYLIDNNYYIIKIEKAFQEGSYIEIAFVFDEIYQMLKNKDSALRRKALIDSLRGVYPVKIDSQKIVGLFYQ